MSDISLFTQSILSIAANILGTEPETLFGRMFVELGGSSLDASRLVVTLMRETGVRLRAVDVMRANDFGALLSALSAPSLQASTPDIRPTVSSGDKIPLTWQQKIIWFNTQLEPHSPKYFFHATLSFKSRPDVTLLRKRFAHALRQHPVMRIRIEHTGKDVFQIVPAQDVHPAEIDFQEITLTSIPPTGRALIEAVKGNRPFDLSTGPLVRWQLIYLPGDAAVLLHTEHHLVHDGISFMAFLDSLDDANVTDEPDYAYFAYALAQRPASQEEVISVATKLSTADLSPFPARGAINGDAPDLHLRLPIPGDFLSAVEDAARKAKTSTFAAFLAAKVHAIGMYRGTQSFIVFSGSDNRPPDKNDTVGMFVSAVPALMHYDPKTKSVEHLHTVNESLQEALSHSNLPLPEIVRTMGQAVRGGNSLITTGFSMLEQTRTSIKIAGQTATVRLGLFCGSAKFPLDAVLLLSGEGSTRNAELVFEGKAASVSEDDIWAIWTMMINWLKEFSGRVSPLPEASVSSVVERVVYHAKLQPDMPALVDDTETISYGEMILFAQRASQVLAGHKRIGILGTSSPRFFAIAFATLYAGRTYVPLPANQSVERLTTMSCNAACDLIVFTGDQAANQLANSLQTNLPDLPFITWQELESVTGDAVGPESSAEEAYIIFTSGSTGVPNGVLVPRAGLDRLCEWVAQTYSFDLGYPVGQWTSVGFDVSAMDVWPTLWAGGSVHIISQDIRTDPIDLMNWLASNVQSVFLVPNVAELLFQLEWPANCRLSTLMSGGDTLHAVPEGLPFRVLNGYGPTETTICATAHWVSPGEMLPPIGLPLPYVQVYVVAEDGQLVTEGEGELWIGGAGVARGYAGDPWKTAARFIPDPYSDVRCRVYRTGDIVYQNADGVLHFRGRRDRQVKIDGVRLELGEIESIAMRQSGVQLAIATMTETKPHIYIVAEVGTDKVALEQAIRYALPSQVRHLGVCFVDTLPLTPSGKIDTRSLSIQSSSETAVYE